MYECLMAELCVRVFIIVFLWLGCPIIDCKIWFNDLNEEASRIQLIMQINYEWLSIMNFNAYIYEVYFAAAIHMELLQPLKLFSPINL